MREINFKKTLLRKKLKYGTNYITIILGTIPKLILTLIVPSFILIMAYSSLINKVSIYFLFLATLALVFFLWFALGHFTKAKLELVNDLTNSEAISWTENEKNNGSAKSILNRLDNGYVALRYEDVSNGANHRDVYFLFDDDKVFVCSIAIGMFDDPSPFHYFTNKSQTKDLIRALNTSRS